MRKNVSKVFCIFLSILFVLSGCVSKEKTSGEELGCTTEETSDSVETSSANSENSEISLSENICDDTVISTENIQQSSETSSSVVSNNAKDIFTVIFKNYDGTVLKTEKVKKGDNATPPNTPSRDGYRFIKWNTDYANVQTDITVIAVFEEIYLPTLVVENVSAKPGTEINVSISVLNNPGLLAMLLNIRYDESILTLTKTSNGSVMSEYMFTPPKNMKSGCNAAWNINDIPNSEHDGEILILHFKVSDNADKGVYSVSVSCLNNAFDNEYKPLSFDAISGSIIVE